MQAREPTQRDFNFPRDGGKTTARVRIVDGGSSIKGQGGGRRLINGQDDGGQE